MKPKAKSLSHSIIVMLALLLSVRTGWTSSKPQKIGMSEGRAVYISNDGRWLIEDISGWASTLWIDKQNNPVWNQILATVYLPSQKREFWPSVPQERPDAFGVSGSFYWSVSAVPIEPENPGKSTWPNWPTLLTCELRDITTGRLRARIQWRNPRYERFVTAQISPKDRIVHLLNENSLLDWDWASGKQRRLVRFTPSFGYDDLFPVLGKFSRDGKSVARARNESGGLWDIRTGKPVKRWKIRFSPSGRFAYFSPDARIAVYQDEGRLRFYRAATGRFLWKIDFESEHQLRFSRAGDLIFIARKNGCDVHDAFSGRRLRHLSGPRVQDLRPEGIIRGDKKWIYTQDKKGQIWRWRGS